LKNSNWVLKHTILNFPQIRFSLPIRSSLIENALLKFPFYIFWSSSTSLCQFPGYSGIFFSMIYIFLFSSNIFLFFCIFSSSFFWNCFCLYTVLKIGNNYLLELSYLSLSKESIRLYTSSNFSLIDSKRLAKGWAKKLKNRLNQENLKKITKKTEPWKKID